MGVGQLSIFKRSVPSMDQLRVSDGMLIKDLIKRDVTSGLLAQGPTVLTKLSVQGMVTRSRLAEMEMAAGSSDPHVALTAADIPGADLSAPFDRHTVPALKWWLLYRGICATGSWNKKKLIDR